MSRQMSLIAPRPVHRRTGPAVVRRRHVGMEEALESSPLQFASDLLNQQLWCWGCDVRHSQGNVLVRQGFERLPPPVKSMGASIYTRPCGTEGTIWLHSYGVYFGVAGVGGIFCRRFSFVPVFSSASRLNALRWSDPNAGEPAAPAPGVPGPAVRLTVQLCEAIAQIETGLREVVSSEERRRSVAKWQPRTGRTLPADELATGWLLLRDVIARAPALLWPECSTEAEHAGGGPQPSAPAAEKRKRI